MLQELKHPAVPPVCLPEITLPFCLVSYWTLNLPEFTAWHMNVNCILWLFMLMCVAVKSSSMNLLFLSLSWQRDKANSWDQLNWAAVVNQSPQAPMFFWNYKCDSSELLCTMSQWAVVARRQLCTLRGCVTFSVGRWQHMGFWVSEGHSRWFTPTALLFLFSSFIHSVNQQVNFFFF